MLKLSSVIVDKRNLIFLVVAIGLIFSLFSRNWVSVENDLTQYLPEQSETKQGVDIMEEQFTTFGSAEVMVANLSYRDALTLEKSIAAVEGVQSVDFDDSSAHYAHASALYSVTFDYDEDEDECLDALAQVQDVLAGYDVYVSTDLGDSSSEIISAEVNVIMVYVSVIVVVVLLLTSQTWAEVPVLLLTFVSAMILNMGTNFLLGTISFVSNSVTSILQLALSLDYAIIFCNRFKEEHEQAGIRDAAVIALSKAIPEIGSSSLTTVGGLVAMMFMQFKIGPDMAICLIKAILFALLSVFLLMPGLLVLFGPLMDKTRHRNFVPKIPFVGKFAYATRFIVPPIFIVLVLLGFHFSGQCPYVYGYETIRTPRLNDTQIAQNMIRDNFTSSNLVALVVPAGDYDRERAILETLSQREELESSMGLTNIEALGGYCLADSLTPRQFAELADIDYELAETVYTAYAVKEEDYGRIVGGIEHYGVPLMDMFLFVCDQIDAGYVTLDASQTATLHDARKQIESGMVQLQGESYSRMLLYLNLPSGGEETYAFLETIKKTAQNEYPKGNVFIAGNSTTEYDFRNSFSRDNTVVSIVSILIVLLVLLFTFNSAGMPVLLILVIQGSIWLNFSVPAFTRKPLFFMGYLVVSSIQMGANIDYAIVIASRYEELTRSGVDRRSAIIETMNFAFPTIITSGLILAVSGILIGRMTSEATIVGIGESLGRGTILSIVLVMFCLPQILIVGGDIVEKTSFSVPVAARRRTSQGRVVLDGIVVGQINGHVNGLVRATVDGDVHVNLISGSFSDTDTDMDTEGNQEGGRVT